MTYLGDYTLVTTEYTIFANVYATFTKSDPYAMP